MHRRGQLLEVVHDVAEIASPLRQQPGYPPRVAGRGQEALERLAQIAGGVRARHLVAGADLRRCLSRHRVVGEGLTARVQDYREVRACIGVEGRQDLVYVHVGQRLGLGDQATLRQRPGTPVAGVELDVHVLEAGLRPQQGAGVAVDGRVPAPDLELHDGHPVLELDVADLAHRHAGDGHALPLSGRDRLGGGEIRLDLVEVGADHRHPLRQVKVLVGEDPAGDPEREDHREGERQEVPQVVADHSPHGPAPVLASRLGGVLRWQGKPPLYGGRSAGLAGRVPSGWSTALPNARGVPGSGDVWTGIEPPPEKTRVK